MNATSVPSRYLQDILSEPERLNELARARPWQTASQELESRRFDRIVLTGMGASLFALLPAWQQLVRAGHAAWLVETGELLHSLDGLAVEGTLLIAASQSGYSAETLALAQHDRSGVTLLGLTNDPASPLGQSADITIENHAGDEEAVSTRSYVNTLGTATGIANTITHEPDPAELLHAAADALAAHLNNWSDRIAAIKESVDHPQRLFILGRGASLAAARCGALILKEAAKCPAEALSTGQFRHGPLELADERLTAIVLAGHTDYDRDRNRRLAADIRRFGGRVVWADEPAVTPEPDLPLASGDDGVGRALAEIVALQLVSVSIAEQTGVEPGVFRHLEKVTTVE